MKRSMILSMALVCLMSASAFAQRANLRDGSDQGEKDFHRHTEDQSYSFKTVDPFGNEVMVTVDAPIANPIPDKPWEDPEHPAFRLELDEFEMEPSLATKASVVVNVYAVADEEYRAKYSSWSSKLNNIIETADNAYWRDYSINWVIQGYYNWTSNGNNSSAILSDLATDGAGLPRGLVMGFSADSRFDAGGIAYVYQSNPGTGYSVCLDQGNSGTISALRHEIGHNYGCSHDFDPVVCLMNYTYSYSIDYFDSAHASLISSRTGWFR